MPVKTVLTCTLCPNGCGILVEGAGGDLRISGEGCPRGRGFAREEVTCPRRGLSTTVRVLGAEEETCPVRLTRPIPRERIMDAAREIHRQVLRAPVREGDVVISGILGEDSDVIAIREMERVLPEA